jgi:hypothetical protein
LLEKNKAVVFGTEKCSYLGYLLPYFGLGYRPLLPKIPTIHRDLKRNYFIVLYRIVLLFSPHEGGVFGGVVIGKLCKLVVEKWGDCRICVFVVRIIVSRSEMMFGRRKRIVEGVTLRKEEEVVGFRGK